MKPPHHSASPATGRQRTFLHVLAVLLLFASTAAWAAPVTWTTSTVSGPSDVHTAGTLVGAMEMGSATPQTINGVTFAANPGGAGPHTLGSGTVTLGGLGITAAVFWPTANPGGDAAYGAALNSGRYSGAASGAITLGSWTEIYRFDPDHLPGGSFWRLLVERP